MASELALTVAAKVLAGPFRERIEAVVSLFSEEGVTVSELLLAVSFCELEHVFIVGSARCFSVGILLLVHGNEHVSQTISSVQIACCRCLLSATCIDFILLIW